MLKKVILLAGIFIVFSACVITSPAEIFATTPTICVECVQATICAENESGDACIIDTPSPVDILPTADPSTDESTPTEMGMDEPIQQKTDIIPSLPDTSPTSTYYQKTPYVFITIPPPDTATPTPTPTLEFTPRPTKTATVDPGTWIYRIQTGSPKYTRNFAHPESACEWSGVAGQVFGPGGAPQTDVVVLVSGDALGTPIDLVGLTGVSTAYGAGAFEVEFPGGPVRTYDTISIQLFDFAGTQLSRPIPFDTYADCTKNLAVINFVSSE